ncbi:hypothetical protein EMIHUDRAFT_106144 [Emiliania huxleyi CCMP1516]|uniref:ATP-dependent DNA ligase family profile domain-containing protein n=2 Tax=Emiliania huxleyi TaxID=2903 RepID=A0A0D3IA16_EMIH1|nr:hypothetical protein EMIHUDRAFT_106144 [Emiliania huxleyi CCMP1516]EOD08101.1 hypothetical protein EMIHUDRAFT_106144 [Emiliania huxleyi CCMP1516]|eukprot:XP_005760530.1 hypothetical protein EMIHUDRAFT_106144 [Emiliania huxleyi CCMP1516]
MLDKENRSANPAAQDVGFFEVARLLDRLEGISGAQARTRCVSRWFDASAERRASTLPLFRVLLVAETDRAFYVKEERLAALTATALGIATDSACGRRLQGWLDPARSGGGDAMHATAGNLSAVVESVVALRAPARAGGVAGRPLAIREVDAAMDVLAAGAPEFHAGRGARSGPHAAVLHGLLSRCSPVEAKWLTRLLLRDLQIRSPCADVRVEWPRSLMDGFLPHQGPGRPGFYSYWLRRGDLGEACGRAELARAMLDAQSLGGACGPSCVAAEWPLLRGLSHGSYVHVALSHPVTSLSRMRKELLGDGGAGELVVQTKYDGERIQLHVWQDPAAPGGRAVRIFSRGGRDSTGRRALAVDALRLSLGADAAPPAGASQHLLAAWRGAEAAGRKPAVRSAILDGEILVFNERVRRVEAFGTVQHLRPGGKAGCDGSRHLCVVWRGRTRDGAASRTAALTAPPPPPLRFDALELNGDDLVSRRAPLVERLERLSAAVTPLDGFVHVAPSELVRAADVPRLGELWAAAREAREEGLVLKAALSPYTPNQRGCWGKLKHDRVDGLGDTITAALVAARWGANDRSGRLGAYGFGAVLNPTEVRVSGAAPRFVFLFWSECGLDSLETKLLGAGGAALLGEPGISPPRMAPLPRGSAPEWLSGLPRGEADRPHFVLRSPADAIPTELLGSDFVPSRGPPANFRLELRFPRIRCVRPSDPLSSVLSAAEYDAAGRAARAPPSEAQVREAVERVCAPPPPTKRRCRIDGSLFSKRQAAAREPAPAELAPVAQSSQESTTQESTTQESTSQESSASCGLRARAAPHLPPAATASPPGDDLAAVFRAEEVKIKAWHRQLRREAFPPPPKALRRALRARDRLRRQT